MLGHERGELSVATGGGGAAGRQDIGVLADLAVGAAHGPHSLDTQQLARRFRHATHATPVRRSAQVGAVLPVPAEPGDRVHRRGTPDRRDRRCAPGPVRGLAFAISRLAFADASTAVPDEPDPDPSPQVPARRPPSSPNAANRVERGSPDCRTRTELPSSAEGWRRERERMGAGRDGRCGGRRRGRGSSSARGVRAGPAGMARAARGVVSAVRGGCRSAPVPAGAHPHGLLPRAGRDGSRRLRRVPCDARRPVPPAARARPRGAGGLPRGPGLPLVP